MGNFGDYLLDDKYILYIIIVFFFFSRKGFPAEWTDSENFGLNLIKFFFNGNLGGNF